MRKKSLIAFLLLLLSTVVIGQTIKKLEHELSRDGSYENPYDKVATAIKLQKLDSFNKTAIEYICRYYKNKKIDSVGVFFDKLIADHPRSPIPYIIRTDFFYFEVDDRNRNEYIKGKEKYLKCALSIDPRNKTVLYKLAENYYKDFIYPFKKERDYYDFIHIEEEEITLIEEPKIIRKRIKRSVLEHPADSALKYFYQLWENDSQNRETIYFPIRQLECYIGVRDQSPINIEKQDLKGNCYFPVWYFANLKEDWECNKTTDYLWDIHSSKHYSDRYAKQLLDLKEPCLYTENVGNDRVILRFTWLRSFHHPISIRMEKKESEVYLYWKVGKGKGGYAPEGLMRKGEKQINLKEWNEFMQKLNLDRFNDLPNDRVIPDPDGAIWLLEYKHGDDFKAHTTNWPHGSIMGCCLYLLSLTDILVEEKDIY